MHVHMCVSCADIVVFRMFLCNGCHILLHDGKRCFALKSNRERESEREIETKIEFKASCLVSFTEL